MGTRSLIGKVNGQKVDYIYCQLDGFVENVGRILATRYNDERKVDELLSLGSLSSLGKTIDTCDLLRGNPEPMQSMSLSEYFDSSDDGMIAFFYLFDEGEWKYRKGGGKPVFRSVRKRLGLTRKPIEYDELDPEEFNESRKVTLTLGQLKRLVRESASEYIGAQNFTYAELQTAWNKLKVMVEMDAVDDDPEDIFYNIRNGYSTIDSKDCNENQWEMDFSFDAVVAELDAVPEMITFGDLEVYWNSKERREADSADHGIFIEDGKIKEVY